DVCSSDLVTPWNFPLAMLTRKIGPALAAGCTVIMKPSSESPLTAAMFMDLIEEAGFPKGVVNLVTGSSSKIVGKIMEDERVRKLTFTRSEEHTSELQSRFDLVCSLL